MRPGGAASRGAPGGRVASQAPRLESWMAARTRRPACRAERGVATSASMRSVALAALADGVGYAHGDLVVGRVDAGRDRERVPSRRRLDPGARGDGALAGV